MVPSPVLSCALLGLHRFVCDVVSEIEPSSLRLVRLAGVPLPSTFPRFLPPVFLALGWLRTVGAHNRQRVIHS